MSKPGPKPRLIHAERMEKWLGYPPGTLGRGPMKWPASTPLWDFIMREKEQKETNEMSKQTMRELITDTVNGLRPQLEDVSKIKVHARVTALVAEGVRRAVHVHSNLTVPELIDQAVADVMGTGAKTEGDR